MRYEDVAIPIPAAWSSPFTKWQGALAGINSLDLAVDVTTRAFDRAGFDAARLDQVVLGFTVPQKESFYGGPTVAARIGAPRVPAPMVAQACATAVACLSTAAAGVDATGGTAAVVTTDRTSNGPVLAYPRPAGPGGAPDVENWVLDNFDLDPWGGTAMVATAEAVAAEVGIGRSELDELTAHRSDQYQEALADDAAFQQPWMVPVEIPNRRGAPTVVDADEGVRASTVEGLAALRPTTPEGVVTFGTQTHPADGTAGFVLASRAEAADIAGGAGVASVLATGTARAERARMPKAPVPAAQAALDDADLTIGDVHVIKTHNPFAVNDVYFAKETGVAVEDMNPFGCSLIYGHPQAPTGARAIVELIHVLRARGGGIGLFTGCAAGDTGAAAVVRVDI